MAPASPNDVLADAGAAVGIRIGDTVASALAGAPADLGEALRQALQFEALGAAYTDIKAAEAEVLAGGASADQATVFRLSACLAVMHRLRLADIAVTASGPAN